MRICIYTQESVEGQKAIRVKEDRIIRTIRKIKQAFGIAQMNELYVSEEHLKEHKKRRGSFEKSMLFASVFAGFIIVIVLFSLIFSGRFDLWAVVSAFIIAGFILALPLFKYSPALEGDEPKIVGSAPSEKKAPAPKKEAKKKVAKKPTRKSARKKKR